MTIKRLNTTGFLFTQTSIAVSLLHADFGDGYRAAALIGSSEGLRTFNLKIEVLPDSTLYPLVAGQTRANYLWDFFLARKATGNEAFWVIDPKTFNQLFLAEFVDDQLSYDILCAKVYAAGLPLRQRRMKGVVSPAAIPNYLTGEVGNVDAKTVVITFSAGVTATTNYDAGVTIKVNGVVATVLSAIRQGNPAVVYYALSVAVPAGAVVTWEYSEGAGTIATVSPGIPLEDVTPQLVTNDVLPSQQIVTEDNQSIVTEDNQNLFTE